jgi:hypothetical protein
VNRALLRLVPTVLAILLAAPAVAASGSAGGYAELRFSALPGVSGRAWTLTERVRPRFEASLHDRIRLYAEVELAFAQGRDTQDEFQRIVDGSEFAGILEIANCAWPQAPANETLHVDRLSELLSVERLYLDIYLPGVDLRVGRQALFWGSALILNPTDPFPELLVAEPWRPRRGTNAVRATFAFVDDLDLTAVLATSDLFSAVRAAGRLRARLGGTDLAIVAAWRGDDNDGIVGVDLRGTFGVGFWLEASYHLGERYYEQLALGLDYSFPVLDGLVVAVQYYRNGGGGVAGPTSVLSSGITPPTCDLPDGSPVPSGALGGLMGGSHAPAPAVFAPLLRGKNYLMAGLSEAFLPELSASVTMLQNLDDGTGFLVPTVSARPTGWLEIAGSAQIPYSFSDEGGEFKAAEDDLVITQDLGPLLGEKTLDLSGLVPPATLTFWTRFSF